MKYVMGLYFGLFRKFLGYGMVLASVFPRTRTAYCCNSDFISPLVLWKIPRHCISLQYRDWPNRWVVSVKKWVYNSHVSLLQQVNLSSPLRSMTDLVVVDFMSMVKNLSTVASQNACNAHQGVSVFYITCKRTFVKLNIKVFNAHAI